METVGQRVKRLRIGLGLSQRDVQGPGVSYAYISRIEAGTRNPSVKVLRMLAASLEVSVEYLETGQDRTRTDVLLERLFELTGGEVRAVVPTKPLAAVSYRYAGAERGETGESVTAALASAVRWIEEYERLAAQMVALSESEQRSSAA